MGKIEKEKIEKLMEGAYDLHIHIAPDVVRRKCTEYEMAERMRARKMAGGAIKCHFFETAARAALVSAAYPELQIVGGIALNRSVGGLNPEAVRKAGMVGARMLWFPTMDALAFQAYKHRDDAAFDPSGLITACDAEGNLKPEVLEVLSVAAQYQMVVGTGHLAPEEGMKVMRAAFEAGVRKVVLTHVEHPAIAYSIAQQKEAASCGAMIEHSWNNVCYDRCTVESFAEQIREAGPAHVILDGDFGQWDAPYFDDAMEEYLETLSDYFTEEELSVMIRENPAELLR
ncbi:MAG: amidohydrolase [Lachnospiraceae bacterium]|nr:amidohydrolase [Lachnospiraceae bacterium]